MLSKSKDEAVIQNILKAYQSFTNSCSILRLTTPREALLTSLCKYVLFFTSFCCFSFVLFMMFFKLIRSLLSKSQFSTLRHALPYNNNNNNKKISSLRTDERSSFSLELTKLSRLTKKHVQTMKVPLLCSVFFFFLSCQHDFSSSHQPIRHRLCSTLHIAWAVFWMRVGISF
jgi:hypothetical protein